MTRPQPSVEGDLLRHAVRDLLGRHPGTPSFLARHLLNLARDYDRRSAFTPRPTLAGRWVRRTCGNAGPGVPGIGHVAAAMSAGLSDAVAVCGTKLRGDLDWAHPARPGNHNHEWRPCRTCVRAILSVTSIRRAAPVEAANTPDAPEEAA